MSKNKAVTITATQGDDPSIVTLRIGNRTKPIIAGVLGTEVDKDGEIDTYYLNCLVHYDDTVYQQWVATGAVSTILKRAPHYVA